MERAIETDSHGVSWADMTALSRRMVGEGRMVTVAARDLEAAARLAHMAHGSYTDDNGDMHLAGGPWAACRMGLCQRLAQRLGDEGEGVDG